MPQYRIGQTATNPKTGQQVKWDGQNWVGVTGTGGRGTAPGGLTPGDRQYLNQLSTEAASAADTERYYLRARGAVRALRPGPYRGRLMQAATPEEGGGIADTLGALIIGGPARLTGAITPEETNAYQILRGLQSEQVLSKQLLQKGPQTESDAARLQLTEISPSKSREANEAIITNGIQRTRRIRARASFYTQWANKYGLHGMNEQGQTADQVWGQNQERIAEQMYGAAAPQPNRQGEIRVLSVTKAH